MLLSYRCVLLILTHWAFKGLKQKALHPLNLSKWKQGSPKLFWFFLKQLFSNLFLGETLHFFPCLPLPPLCSQIYYIHQHCFSTVVASALGL